MATNLRMRGTSGAAAPSGIGLRILSVMLGIFLIAMSLSKLAWFIDSNILLQKLQLFLAKAPPMVRWYLETVCIPGAPVFARLVPLGEFACGAALIAGFWTRMAAVLALAMVINFHFATSAFWSLEFLRDGTGLPVIGGLLATALGGARLPFSVTRN